MKMVELYKVVEHADGRKEKIKVGELPQAEYEKIVKR